MSLDQFATWLDGTPPSIALKDTAFAIPVAQSVHILAIAFVLSGSVLLSARSYDLFGTQWSVGDWGRKLTGRLWIALALLALSGSLLVLAEPTRELVNRVFQVKLALIVPTVAFAAWLARRQVASGARAAVADRIASAVLLALWLAIACAGRWIAYV